MKLFDVIKNDYFRLFVKREGKVVLGKNYSNLWLLTAVLTATFLAIAFSNGSLDYLSYKMDDPFINLDDEKLRAGSAFLKEVAEKYQIIYFTCSNTRSYQI